MTLLVQITDTHILPPGEFLHGSIDTATHLRDTVGQINRIQPKPDMVLITGVTCPPPPNLSHLPHLMGMLLEFM